MQVNNKDHHGKEIPLIPYREKAKTLNKPDAGHFCLVAHGNFGEKIGGKVLYYFDDENGIEHVRVDIDGLHLIRQASDVNDDSSNLIK